MMTKESKHFYKKVALLVIPMAIQNLINAGISSIDVIMLGRVGEKVLSGASLGAQVQFVINLIIFGLVSGASVLMAQYWGKRDMYSFETIFGMAIKVAFGLGMIWLVVTLLIPEPLMKLFSNDEEVIQYGVVYLKCVCWSYPFCALTTVYLNSIRNLGKVVIATVVYLSSMITNIIMNGILIFGLFGCPKMGIAGAAIGTVVARLVEFGIIIIYDQKINDLFRFHFYYLWRKNENLLKDFVHYSTPVVINELMWGLGMSTMAAILGHMGSEVTAANSVAQITRNLATVISFGVASASAILIGHAIGEGRNDLVKMYGKRLIIISFVTGLLGGLLILFLRPVLLATMVLSDGAQKYLSYMMYLMAIYVVNQAVNTTLIVGIFRGGGDTKFGLFIDAGIMWGVSILGAFLCAFVFDTNIYIVIAILLSDEHVKVPVSLFRYHTYCWIKNVTRS